MSYRDGLNAVTAIGRTARQLKPVLSRSRTTGGSHISEAVGDSFGVVGYGLAAIVFAVAVLALMGFDPYLIHIWIGYGHEQAMWAGIAYSVAVLFLTIFNAEIVLPSLIKTWGTIFGVDRRMLIRDRLLLLKRQQRDHGDSPHESSASCPACQTLRSIPSLTRRAAAGSEHLKHASAACLHCAERKWVRLRFWDPRAWRYLEKMLAASSLEYGRAARGYEDPDWEPKSATPTPTTN